MVHFPSMAESLAETITQLLRASRAAHDRARTARQQKQPVVAAAELTLARDLRVEAQDADPEHTALAWAAEMPAHTTMMDFYVHKLGA